MFNTQPKITNFTGKDLLIESLLKQKTEVLFGSVNGSQQSIYNCFDHSKINKVIFKHEQSTIHAADGYARATGKVGVVFLPSGSAITNGLTGILTAQMDSIPLVVIIKTLKENLDLFGIMTPITKYHIQIQNINEIQKGIDIAFKIAFDGRPGTVVIELVENVLDATYSYHNHRASMIEFKKEKETVTPRIAERLKEEIRAAQKPVLLIGGGS